MVERVERICQACRSNVGFTMSDNGFFYCGYCNAEADDIVDTGVDEEQVFTLYSVPICSRVRGPTTNVTAVETVPEVKLTTSQYWDHPDVSIDDVEDLVDGVGPTRPSDFGSSKKRLSYDEYYCEVRSRYLTGIQIMIQLQCEALVEKFSVTPLIVGLVGPIWLRFLASTRVMAEEWADGAVHDSEAQTQGEAEKFKPSARHPAEPVNIHGKRVVYVWYRSLRRAMPLSVSLALSYLACHVAREAITPPDMLKWILEGKLPYFAAFVEIEKQLGSYSDACPIGQIFNTMAGGIAMKIGLQLPPVNFYAIAARDLRQLSLSTGDILPFACRMCEWSTPPELYISANDFRIPARVCVMSILIVTLRILFDINGYGIWKSSLSNPSCSSSPVKNEDTESGSCLNTRKNADDDLFSNNSEPSRTKLNVVELLRIFEANFNKPDDAHAYSSDLPSYLQYCEDVVFSGLRPSYEDLEEEKLLVELWDFYRNNKEAGALDNQGENSSGSSGLKSKRSKDGADGKQDQDKKTKGDQNTSNITSQKSESMGQENHCDGVKKSAHGSTSSKESPKDKAIRQLKLDMEDNKFYYIPPRVKVKNKDYLHYHRRMKDAYVYAVHADYYLSLRSCAKVAQVEMRIMHIAVLSLERRLQWLEKMVDSFLNLELNFNNVFGFCKDKSVQNTGYDPMDLND